MKYTIPTADDIEKMMSKDKEVQAVRVGSPTTHTASEAAQAALAELMGTKVVMPSGSLRKVYIVTHGITKEILKVSENKQVAVAMAESDGSYLLSEKFLD